MICKLNKKHVNKYYKEESDAALRRQIYYGSCKLIVHNLQRYVHARKWTWSTADSPLLKTKLFPSWVEMRALNKMFRFSFVFNCCCFLEAKPLQLTFSYGRARIFIDTINLRDPLYCSLTDFLFTNIQYFCIWNT